MARIEGGGSADANHSRNRLRQEVAYLRETVQQLEGELARLRAPCQSTEMQNKPLNERAIDAAWKDIALRQRGLRYQTEVENVKLRAHLEEQLRLTKTLEKLLHKRQHSEMEWVIHPRSVNGALSTAPPIEKKGSLLDDEAIIQMLKATIPTLVVKTDDVFANNEQFKKEVGSFRHVELRATDDEGTFVETTERRCLPFDRNVMSDGLMAQFGDWPGDVVKTENPSITEEVIVKDMISTVDTARFRGHTRSKLALRRVYRADSTVIALSALSDPWTATGTAMDGVYVRHYAWFRIRELQTTPQPSKPLTEVCTYHQAIPEVYGAVPDQKRKVGALTNFLLATLGFQMDVARDGVDNWLLARAMNTSQREHTVYSSSEV